MRDKLKASFERFLSLPDYRAQPDAGHATQANPCFEIRRIRADSQGDPEEDDLNAVVYLSHDNARIRRANENLGPERREALYTIWFRANPDTFAVLERIPADKHGVAIVANSAILPLRRDVLDQIIDGRLAVIDLKEAHIRRQGDSFDALLLDTWVAHNDYQESSWFGLQRNRHYGYANALVLKHLSYFWDPSAQSSIRIYAEPDARSMLETLPRLGFEHKGATKIGEPLFELQYPPMTPDNLENAVQRRYMRKVIAGVQQARLW